MTSVLVTGVGGVTGYGLMRDLRGRRPEIRLVGADIHHDAIGGLWSDRFVVAVPAASAEYSAWLLSLLEEEEIDVMIPTLDAELDAMIGWPDVPPQVVLNSQQALRVSRDKWELDRLLVRHDELVRIPSSVSTDFAELAEILGLPFILKRRRGYGARGLVSVADAGQFAPYATRMGVEYLAQQHVGDDDSEFTVGAFGDGSGRLNARIVMRRWLSSEGFTRRAEVVPPPVDLDEALVRLGRLVAPLGPTNFQFRSTSAGWKLLEVNARVSSSGSMRALAGYHDAEMAIDFHVAGVSPQQPDIEFGTIVRHLEDRMVQ